MDNPTSCDGDNEDEFPFKAFRLSGQTVNEKIVFTVTAKVCYDGFPGCECNCGDRILILASKYVIGKWKHFIFSLGVS